MSQIKVNSIVPVGGLPSGANGGIIQTIQTAKTDTFSTTSSTFTDVTGLSATITPSSNSNKVLVKVSLGFVSGYSSNSAVYPHFVLVRGSTEIGKGDASGNRTDCSFAVFSLQNLDHLKIELSLFQKPQNFQEPFLEE